MAAIGLTKARITQIRSSAPPARRAFFGGGPLDIALPGRRLLNRDDLVIASEEDATGVQLTDEVERLMFTVERHRATRTPAAATPPGSRARPQRLPAAASQAPRRQDHHDLDAGYSLNHSHLPEPSSGVPLCGDVMQICAFERYRLLFPKEQAAARRGAGAARRRPGATARSF
ncbi:hypothetical protein Ae168Ps1_3751 [Pseudonocardia sp. Ae168_Ps1]|nr:hypothetical protein Ae168Ps1_3751 [Pseudonocardia sp. Ae168_Ps1]OLL84541.1 hypothetical protein Ae263Ps1_1596c [Pseudonocardia sp. Ae263_Ps1]OLL95439.1 hypothetical protein Ae356Ps1_5336 [Pseudonocardia sp. Ae356_Ps1]